MFGSWGLLKELAQHSTEIVYLFCITCSIITCNHFDVLHFRMWADGNKIQRSLETLHVFEWCVANQKCTPGLAHNDTVIRRVWGMQMVLLPSTSYDRETPDRPTATTLFLLQRLGTLAAACAPSLLAPCGGKTRGCPIPQRLPGCIRPDEWAHKTY